MTKQKIKDFFANIYNYPVVKTPIIALAIVAGGILVFFIFLHIFTRHGQGFPVPDFTGLEIEKAEALAQKKGLLLEVSDSVYIITREPGTVTEQNPSPSTFVKANRRVFITINAKTPLMVEMSNIVGLTLRQAKSTLDLQGFSIENLSFVRDIAVNNVLEQRYMGKIIEPGTSIPKGSKISLVLGKGFSNDKTALPKAIGLTLAEARNLLIDASLNMGKLIFDATVKDERDTLLAKVYSQYPYPVTEMSVGFGARVDLWLTLNESRIPKEEEPVKKDEKKEIIYEVPEEEILE